MANFAISSFLLSAAYCYAAPLKGSDLSPRQDGVAVLNEPCYVHDAACEGYPVCCVKVGTCKSLHSGTVSSNLAYYEGGCQSKESSKKAWAEDSGCTQQGECVVQHIEVCKGGFTKEGFMADLPAATLERFMTGSCEASCPNANYGHRSYSQATESNVTTTTTTTTTISVTIQGEFTMASSDAAKMDMTVGKKNELFGMLIAHMAGSDVTTSMVSHTIKTSGASNAVSFTVTMSHTDATKSQEAEATVDKALKGWTKPQMDDATAKIFGTCDYTLSASAPVCVGTPKSCALTESSESSLAARSVSLMMTLVAIIAITAYKI